MEELILNFNKQQLEAINFHNGACAVIAGAGSGKSTVLLNRVKNLVEKHNVPESEILTISFTRNTANELKSKLKNMGLWNVNVGTFHSICARILALENIRLDQAKMIRDWQIENLFQTGDTKVDTKDIISFISYQKNYLRSYNDKFVEKDSKYSESELRKYFKSYETYKEKNGLHDFDDYLIWCLEAVRKSKYKHTFEYILVDEHQDSNLVQNLLLKEWCESGNIFCVFDYKQAIYSFRGGNPEYSMNFANDWEDATTIHLDTNYRSASNVVSNANSFIRNYYGDYEHYSELVPSIATEGVVNIKTHSDKEEEAKDVAEEVQRLLENGTDPNEIVVLYRLNAHSFYIEHELRQRNVDYHIVNDSSFFKRKEVSGVLAYLRLAINPDNDGAFMEIFNELRNYPLTYFGRAVFNDIKKISNNNDISLFEAFSETRFQKDWQASNREVFIDSINYLKRLYDGGASTYELVSAIINEFRLVKYIEDKYSNDEEIKERIDSLEVLKTFVRTDSPEKFLDYVDSTSQKKPKKNCLKLMTIHASKGLEFENVFLIGVEDGKFPHERSDLVDEARLFYVGVTRPKDNLYISQIFDDNRFIKEYTG